MKHIANIKEKIDIKNVEEFDGKIFESTSDAEYLKDKIKKSEEDIKNGRVMTIEESKERLRIKYEDCYI